MPLRLIAGAIQDAPIHRRTVRPSPETGLRVASQVMADEIATLRRTKCGAVVGRLDPDAIAFLDDMLTVVIGIAD